MHTAEEYDVLGRIQNSTLYDIDYHPLQQLPYDLTWPPRMDMRPRMGHRPNNPELYGPINRTVPTIAPQNPTFRLLGREGGF